MCPPIERIFFLSTPKNNGLRRFCSQRARVQRGPSEAARCASTESEPPQPITAEP
jgi:hypothetical protein